MARYFYTALALVLIAAPCQAQTRQAVDLVPDDASGFLLIKDLRELSDKVEQLAKKLNVAQRVSLLELIHKEMGIREGINDKGSALFIVLKTKDKKNDIAMVFALPVADHHKIAQQLAVKNDKDAIAEGEVGLQSGLWLTPARRRRRRNRATTLAAGKSEMRRGIAARRAVVRLQPPRLPAWRMKAVTSFARIRPPGALSTTQRPHPSDRRVWPHRP
jgi:hypothetical protein